MKRVDLPLAKLSVAEKLYLMETLWADLTHDEKKLKSPAWHEIILKDREQAYAAGKIGASEWEETKRKLRKKLS